MTVEELQAKLEAAEAEKAAIAAEAATLKENSSNQNSYITKIEGENKSLKSTLEGISKTASKPAELDPYLIDYFKKKRKEDVISEAYAQIKVKVSPEVFLQLEPELQAFLKQSMTDSNTSEAFVVDAFNLIYGRALTDGTINVAPKEQPAETNEDKKPSEVLQSFTDNPPVMTPLDKSATSDLPGSHPQAGTIKNTDEAINALKSKFSNFGNDIYK